MKKKSIIFTFLGFAVLSVFFGIWVISVCNVEQEMRTSYQTITIQDIPSEKWALLTGRNIYFGHMSVGFNIIDGIKDILSENPDIRLNITELKAPAHSSLTGFCHATIEYNAKPLDKIRSFQSQMAGLEGVPDIAFMKFCYVDFYAQTDVHEIFDGYRDMIAELQEKFPETIFMHCTVPLTTSPLAPKRKVKEMVKKCLGKSTTIDHNQVRTEFGNLLKKNYPPETIIDLAKFESTTPDGTCYFKTKKGVKVPFLYDQFTSDGGHLNEAGRKRVAEQLLIHLANYQ